MYRGEAFALQMDAHCVFVNGWDESIIAQWRTTRAEASLTDAALSDTEETLEPLSLRQTLASASLKKRRERGFLTAETQARESI